MSDFNCNLCNNSFPDFDSYMKHKCEKDTRPATGMYRPKYQRNSNGERTF